MLLFGDVTRGVNDPHLAHAIQLAVTARGATAPNPLVGAVVVREGVVVGRGFHARAGDPHAERIALSEADEQAVGADLYVTLEPCSHHGKTPPCTQAIIDAGITRVVVGMPDPDPVAAGGAVLLREAGVRVDFAVDPAPFARINAGWLKRLETGRPHVTVKVALSLDGHPALDAGRRSAISGPAGAQVTRALRESVQAVMVGTSTVIIDDPALTVRDADGRLSPRQPLRVVLARETVPPREARVFTDGLADTLLIAPSDKVDSLRITHGPGVEVASNPDGSSIKGALGLLADRGINDVLIEAGPTLLASLWAEGLIDRLVVVTAGGMAGPDAPVLYAGKPDRDEDALRPVFVPVESGIVDDVAVCVWEPQAHDVDSEGKTG